MSSTMSESDQKVYYALKKNSFSSAAVLSVLTKIPERQVEESFRKLKANGLIVQQGGGGGNPRFSVKGPKKVKGPKPVATNPKEEDKETESSSQPLASPTKVATVGDENEAIGSSDQDDYISDEYDDDYDSDSEAPQSSMNH
jgi:biotin operon repressor